MHYPVFPRLTWMAGALAVLLGVAVSANAQVVIEERVSFERAIDPVDAITHGRSKGVEHPHFEHLPGDNLRPGMDAYSTNRLLVRGGAGLLRVRFDEYWLWTGMQPASVKVEISSADTTRRYLLPLKRERFVREWFFQDWGLGTYNDCLDAYNTDYTFWSNFGRTPPDSAYVDLGFVQPGDTVYTALRSHEHDNLLYTSGGEAWYPEEHYYEQPMWAYALEFGATRSCRNTTDFPGQLDIRLLIQASRLGFMRQTDNGAVPDEGINRDEAVLMVSKRLPTTEDGLPEGAVPFEATGPDRDTFRPQATYLPAGVEAADVQFRVQVLRDGTPTDYDHTFDAVRGTVDERPAFRADRFLRLVSNARPPEMRLPPYSDYAKYDDEYAGAQTILVRLGDTVRTSLVLDGEDTGVYAERPVGRPAGEAGRNAIRYAWVHFVEIDGLTQDVQPAETIRRMSEDWAQVGIAFELAGTSVIEPVRNALLVERVAAGTHTLRLEPEGAPPVAVTVEVPEGAGREAMAEAIASAVREAGVPAAHYRHVHRGTVDWFVVVDRGNGMEISWDTSLVEAVDLPKLSYRERIDLFAGNVLGLNHKDDDPRTIDLIAVHNQTIVGKNGKPGSALGRAGSDVHAATMPGWQNTIIIEESSVNAHDASNPLTAGHEAGHVLFDFYLPNSDSSHSPDPRNLMSTDDPIDHLEDYLEGKRLTEEQQDDARRDSETHTPVPLLHKSPIQ